MTSTQNEHCCFTHSSIRCSQPPSTYPTSQRGNAAATFSKTNLAPAAFETFPATTAKPQMRPKVSNRRKRLRPLIHLLPSSPTERGSPPFR